MSLRVCLASQKQLERFISLITLGKRLTFLRLHLQRLSCGGLIYVFILFLVSIGFGVFVMITVTPVCLAAGAIMVYVT